MISKKAMKAALRGFISCILPCGSFDVIRIVHCNGKVEEFSKSIKAEEVMKAHPKHVLKRSSLCPSENGVVPTIVILPPDAELKRGKIYFLMRVPSPPASKEKVASTNRRKKRDHQVNERKTDQKKERRSSSAGQDMSKHLASDQYLSEIMSETISTPREHRRGRVGVWRPHLESITEASISET